jgi:hypothetical protein
MQHLRLAHPELDFWVDMRLHPWEDGWIAEAELAGEREVGVGSELGTAIRRALASLGERYATEMAASADLAL